MALGRPGQRREAGESLGSGPGPAQVRPPMALPGWPGHHPDKEPAFGTRAAAGHMQGRRAINLEGAALR